MLAAGIKAKSAKTSMYLVEIFDPTYPFFLAIQIFIILFATFRHTNKRIITSKVKIDITILGVAFINGNVLVKLKKVSIAAVKDKINKNKASLIFIFS